MKGWKNKYIPIKPGVPPTEGNYFASTNAQDIIKVMSYIGQNRPDIKNIVLETDAPYLSPVPFRGKRNESSYITYVVDKLATIYDVSFEEIVTITTKNSKEVFGI